MKLSCVPAAIFLFHGHAKAATPEEESEFTAHMAGFHKVARRCLHTVQESTNISFNVRDGKIEAVAFDRLSVAQHAEPCIVRGAADHRFSNLTGEFVRLYPDQVLTYCVAEPFEPPSSRNRSRAPGIKAFREGEFPGPLLPMNRIRAWRTKWYDRTGNVFGASTISKLWRIHPATAPHVREVAQALRLAANPHANQWAEGDRAWDLYLTNICRYNRDVQGLAPL